MATQFDLTLSPSKLGTLNDCPRCFVMENASIPGTPKVPRPRGIFPGLPSGMDAVIKQYHEGFRTQKVLPPYLVGQLPGILYPDVALLKKLQFWKTGPTYETEHRGRQVLLRGAIDELIRREDNSCSTADFKTKGSEPRDDNSQYYGTQLDCYELMLPSKGFVMSSGIAFLIFVWPESQTDPDNPLSPFLQFNFRSKVYSLKADPQRAKALLLKAVDLIVDCEEGKGTPDPSQNCEYCRYDNARKGWEVNEYALEMSK